MLEFAEWNSIILIFFLYSRELFWSNHLVSMLQNLHSQKQRKIWVQLCYPEVSSFPISMNLIWLSMISNNCYNNAFSSGISTLIEQNVLTKSKNSFRSRLKYCWLNLFFLMLFYRMIHNFRECDNIIVPGSFRPPQIKRKLVVNISTKRHF